MKLDDYLREVDERAGKATEGPWLFRAKSGTFHKTPDKDSGYTYGKRIIWGEDGDTLLDDNNGNDIELMIHSRTDITRLVLLLRAAEHCINKIARDGEENMMNNVRAYDSTVADILEGKDGA